MQRPTSMVELIALPTVPASENVTFAEALESRAAAEALPADLQLWIGKVAEARGLLQGAVALQANTPTDARPERSVLTGSWSAVEAMVSGHLRMPEHPDPAQRQAAQEVFDAVFAASGLAFTAGTTHEELFGTSSSLLKVLETRPLKGHVLLLGLSSLVAALRRAHDRFGRTSGITAPPENADIAGLMAELRDHVRCYLGKVIAWALDGATQRATADRLLQPWADWQPASASAAAAPPVVPAAPAVTPAAPAAMPLVAVAQPVAVAMSALDSPFTDDEGGGS